MPEVQYLIKIPDNMTLSTAAMLPSGALWAMTTVFNAHNHVEKVLSEKGETGELLDVFKQYSERGEMSESLIRCVRMKSR